MLNTRDIDKPIAPKWYNGIHTGCIRMPAKAVICTAIVVWLLGSVIDCSARTKGIEHVIAIDKERCSVHRAGSWISLYPARIAPIPLIDPTIRADQKATVGIFKQCIQIGSRQSLVRFDPAISLIGTGIEPK